MTLPVLIKPENLDDRNTWRETVLFFSGQSLFHSSSPILDGALIVVF